MKIEQPFSISSRLLPALEFHGAVLQIKPHARDDERRPVWHWIVDLNGKTYEGTDLRGGVGDAHYTWEGFKALIGFLSAAAESYNTAERSGADGMTGECANLFPREVTAWAATYSDELAGLSHEMENGPVRIHSETPPPFYL